MELSNKSARELYQAVKADPNRRRFGFGRKPALVNVDLQMRLHPAGRVRDRLRNRPEADRLRQRAGRACSVRQRFPVVWTYVAYLDSGEDCGDLGHAHQHAGLPAEHQGGLAPRRSSTSAARSIARDDIIVNKRMASAFFETNLGSLCTFHKVDTVIVTGGSTSGCVRATVVDSLSRSFRTIVPEECVADKHESPHFANLYDMALKYADVLPVAEVVSFMEQYKPAN